MILKIYPINGNPDLWEEGTFDTWCISNDGDKIFVVKDKKWVGFYRLKYVKKIILAEEIEE
nr:MAG TPA: hypothetical protein [Caudoviricetes sp.]